MIFSEILLPVWVCLSFPSRKLRYVWCRISDICENPYWQHGPGFDCHADRWSMQSGFRKA